MQYYRLKYDFRPKKELSRVVENLELLRKQLDDDIPPKDSQDHLLLATWNIRDLGKKNRKGFGPRLPESHYYIAEVISRFDFVAVQELNELEEWEDRVMRILGPNWDYIATDVADSASGGNGERMAFVFDRRKVWFQKIAGEIVLPANLLISKATAQVTGNKFVSGKQFRRTPFICRFQSGWFKFEICTVRIYYGEDSGEKLAERIEEIDRIAGYLAKRADQSLKQGRAIILLGDFNIVHPEHETMQALLNHGFKMPQNLRKPANIGGDKYYDQISFKTDPEVIEFVERKTKNPGKSNAGVFDIFEKLYTESQFEQFKKAAAESPNGKKKKLDDLKKYYLNWRTYQFSDHKPMWVRLRTNESQAYLQNLKES